MTKQFRIAVVAAAAPIALVLLATTVFALDRASNGGEILGEVTAAGTPLGGLTESEARQVLLGLEAHLASTPITVTVASQTFSLLPSEVGFGLDVEAMLAEATANGRNGSLPGQFGWWLGNLTGGTPAQVAFVTGYRREALDRVLDRWVVESIDNPAFEGGIEIVDGMPQALYPRAGVGIDHDASAELVAAALADLERKPIELPTQTIIPVRTPAQIDALVARVEQDAAKLIDGPITLSWLTPPISVRFEQPLLARSLRARIVDDAGSQVELYFDADPLITFLLGIRDQIEQPPLDARIVARHDEAVSIIPGRSELLVDDAAVSEAVMRAARSATKAGVFPFKEGRAPELTTEQAEALGVDTLLYRATTFFTPGGDEKNLNRIHNIQLIASQVDGALVMPGERWSLNEHVGRRTLEGGYRRAGAIIGDIVDCCDHPANIGGGVSQFATTIFNAVFFSGVEVVAHTPHTLYIPRYPEGREATLGWPTPDVVFRNNTPNAILISTESTDSSVTVRFYGNNGGLEVEAGLSERRNHRDPHDRFEGNASVDPEAEPEQKEKGSPGWTVTVFRYITYPDGRQTTETWVWTYSPNPNIFEVHPCKLPKDHEDYQATCPAGVPNLTGNTASEAEARIKGREWEVKIVETGSCEESQDGRVVAQSPEPGSFLAPGKTVTITVCRWQPPEPPPEDDDG